MKKSYRRYFSNKDGDYFESLTEALASKAANDPTLTTSRLHNPLRKNQYSSSPVTVRTIELDVFDKRITPEQGQDELRSLQYFERKDNDE